MKKETIVVASSNKGKISEIKEHVLKADAKEMYEIVE